MIPAVLPFGLVAGVAMGGGGRLLTGPVVGIVLSVLFAMAGGPAAGAVALANYVVAVLVGAAGRRAVDAVIARREP